MPLAQKVANGKAAAEIGTCHLSGTGRRGRVGPAGFLGNAEDRLTVLALDHFPARFVRHRKQLSAAQVGAADLYGHNDSSEFIIGARRAGLETLTSLTGNLSATPGQLGNP